MSGGSTVERDDERDDGSGVALPSPGGAAARLRARLLPEDVVERRFNIGVAAAMAVGLAVRVAFVLVKQSQLTLTTGDAFWYHMQARLVADGRGFLNPFLLEYQDQVGPGADHPPGFVLVLAALDLLGISSPQGQRLVMCCVGTVTILLIALLARRLAGPVVGVVAAAIAAVYPNMWINDGMLMVETLYVAAIAVSLLATYSYLDAPRRGTALVLSTALMVAAMTRPESLLLYVAVVAPLVLSRRRLPRRERIAQLALAAVVPVAAFAPWVLYNLGRFEEPVLISTGAGQTLAAGNCIHTYTGENLGYYDLRCIEAPAIEVPEGDPSEKDPEFRRLAFDYMADNVGELPRVMAARVARVWHLYAPAQSLNLDGWVEGRAGGMPSGDKSIVTAALVSYYALLVPALAGGVVLVRRRVTIWPLLVQPALVTVIVAFTFGITRYRAGAEITLVVLAAVGLHAAWSALARRRGRTGGASTEPEPSTLGGDR